MRKQHPPKPDRPPPLPAAEAEPAAAPADAPIAQDLDYQEAEWRFERIGWLALLAVMAAGLSGLLGGGAPLPASARSPDGTLQVEFPRFVHRHEQVEVRFLLARRADSSPEARLRLDQAYLDGVQVVSVCPQPERVEAGSAGHTYVFRVAAPGEAINVIFYVQAERHGTLDGTAVIPGMEPVNFWQFAYP